MTEEPYNGFAGHDPEEPDLGPPIPDRFYSTETGKPFERCISCDRELLSGDVRYFIEKAVRTAPTLPASEVVFEYAMCASCQEELWERLSRESVQRITAFMGVRMSHRLAVVDVTEEEMFRSDWLDHCTLTGQPTSELTEYQIACSCFGTRLDPDHPPVVIGGPVMDEVAELLSNATLDTLGGFMDEVFPLPPELRSLFRETDLLIV